MNDQPLGECRSFLTYSGVKLPLNLLTPLSAEELNHRNTFFRGYFDPAGRMVACHKVVYGEIEFEHRYTYHDSGKLRQAVIHVVADEETTTLDYAADGETILATAHS
jgi:hypothetical protein